MNKVKLALPKGSLQETTLLIFKRAGFEIYANSKSYYLSIDDPEIECVLLRTQEIPRYVESGAFDAGIAGKDWIEENKAKIVEVCELTYSKTGFKPVKIVLAVPEKSNIKSVKDLEGKTISTELVNLTKEYLKKHNVKANVEFSYGATEIKAGNLVDAIVEITETGSTLLSHNLKIIDVIMESTPRLIANKESWKDKWKREKIENIALLLKGALTAEGKVGLKMNVEKKNLEKILKILPAIKKPTISHLTDENWYAVETIIDKNKAKELIPKLKKLGANGIVEYPLNKVI
ncbi:MAG: ATP phosphoribosyltransferase [Candidatus Omnitrophica bacterium]|nr:ATP phosphoribosyltransferase [Candidatus Omnitrophota bacterium]MCM8807204.1 ATP phosphoribosyltransferase [Candidatus Omnitrophota bacterium]